ncbi:T9SS type B sorting domain-containing protein [Polaribacter sp. Asnod1-A03]|uniref:T9SS type B sorting domain-containing protein n=1 Tax=Polaribacter sp. Asnod1-A03 TaxID=3160581 RepID=UPI0038655C76
MKKRLILIFFCSLFYFPLNAQNNNDCWTLINNGIDIYNGQYNNNEFPGYHDPETTDLKEVNGGFLTTGQYNKQTFGSNDNNIYNNLKDKDGSYLTKHDYNGNLKWIVYTEKNSNSYRDVMFGSTEDKQGNIYVIGHSIDGTFFDSQGTELTLKNSTNSLYGGFIVKLNENGEILWHIIINNVYSKKINIDNEDNILLSGDVNIYFNNTFNFYLNGAITDNLQNFEVMGNNFNYPNRGIIKINPNGELLWYTAIKTSGSNSEFLIDIGSDKNNNIYVTGYCSSNAEIYSAGKINNPNIINWSGNPTKTFLIKFDKDGQFLWKVKSLLNDSEINGVQAWSTTVDEQGNSYITGSNDRWRKNVNQIFENADGSTTSENVGTFFIAKINTDGICEWIKGAAHTYSGTGYKVIKADEEIAVVGTLRAFNSNVANAEFLSADGNNQNISLNTSDYFIAVYDKDGNLDRIISNGINDERVFPSDRISGFFKDSNDNYYISRNIWFYTDSTVDYINFGHIINARDVNGRDGTITKFNESCGIRLGKTINDNISNLSLCDNTSVGSDSDSLIEFDLTERENEILINEPLSDYQISYYRDSALTDTITNPKKHKNTSQKETIYIKAEHFSDTDKSGQTLFNIEVIELPNVNTIVELKQCDNSDINGFSFFNLNEVKEEIITNSDDYTITFYEEKIDAENNGVSITDVTTYKNEIVSVDKVWARVENSNGCYRVSEVNLFVSTTQIPSTLLNSFYHCDDGTNTADGIATFDFSSVTSDIENIFPTGQQLIINYYRNEDDALAEENAITDITNYQNIGYPNQQNIFIRVDSKFDNDCLGLGAHISLNVEKAPIANPVTIDPECDNDRDRFYSFDTSTIQNTIIGSQTDVTVTYFDENNSQLSSPLPNPFITKTQNITVRVENTNSKDLDGKCYDETTINFMVNTVPIANPILPQEECDDDFDGIVGFDTSNIQNTILGTQTGLIVTYFDENNNSLPSPLPNPFYTTSQTITVRLENPVYDVCSEETTIDFIVRGKPNFNLVDEATICMSENTSLPISVENPNGNYTYIWKNENNQTISTNPYIDITKGGTYNVIATSIYGCNSEEKQIFINESSLSTININDIEVKDDSDNNYIKINNSNLGLGNYVFRLLDSTSNIIYNYQSNANFENLEGGNYFLEIDDLKGCGSLNFEISLISFPKYFTPNGDGKNDYWQIKGLDNSYYKSGIISIYNRFGKLISKFTINDIGWDGTYNGKLIPSNDYWFNIILINYKDEIKKRTGHFSLIRN